MRNKWLVFCTSLLLGATTTQAYTNLTECYAAMGFNPSAPGNALVVLFSDAHLDLQGGGLTLGLLTTNLDPRLVNNVNAMVPPPARIIVSGDETTSYSECPGQLWEWAVMRIRGSNEMRLWVPAIQAFTNIAQTNIFWVPGNHDQDPRETNAELFCQMFPQMPPYQRFDLAGVRFFLLNGGNSGFMSDSEEQWLKQQVALTSPTQTVAVVIHQPALGVTRGNAIVLREDFRDWPARWWTFCGHGHEFCQDVYDIGRSNVTMSEVGSVNTNVFNGQSMNPGFMVLCLSNGIAGRVYYHFLDGSFEVVAEPDWQNPIHYMADFEGVNGLLWRREKNFGIAPPEVIVTNVAYDAGDHYAYIIELQWALALGRHGNQATHFLMSTYILPGAATVSFSADRTNWIEVPLGDPTNGIYFFPIPTQVAGLATGYARLLSATVTNWSDIGVQGWGLATTDTPPWITFPQFAPVPDQSTIAGRILTVTNTDIDPYAPPDVLNFSLLSGPAGATVDPRSGLFSWQPPITGSPTTATVTVQVFDNGTVPMCATQQFSISVAQPADPTITAPQWTSGQYGFTVSGDSGLGYTIWASTNLRDWTLFGTNNPPSLPFQITDPDATNFPRRFYRVAVAPAGGLGR